MIKKNVVLIETVDSVGTGYMYPCAYNGKIESKDEISGNSYIVITNHHVLGYIQKKDVRDSVKLTFYDDWGDLVRPDDIVEIKLFDYENEEDRTREEDIVALLVVLKKGIRLTLSKGIQFEQLENRELLYVEGYPGVLFEDEVSQRIQLEGMEKNIFPFNDRVGAYQITDDYHWYNSLADRELLQGLSGSPVFVKKNGKEFLLGINQSIANVDDGKNPFKIVYYLKIEHVLNYLREHDCIIFRKISKTEVQIEWIYEQELASENDITILMIGGSGAGKSSIARNFAFHGNVINSTNDGQTTRTDIIYQYSITEKEPKATVSILNQKKFVKQMLAHVDIYACAFWFEKAFELSKDFVTDEKKLMKNIFQTLCIIGDIESKKEGNEEKYKEEKAEILCCLEDELINEDKIKLYQSLLNLFLCSEYSSVLKYILDEEEVKKIRELIRVTGENTPQNIPEPVLAVIKEFNENNFKFDEYREKLIATISKEKKIIRDEDLNEIENLKKHFYKLVLHCEGFFDLKEFKYLLCVEDVYDIGQLESKWGKLVNQNTPEEQEYPDVQDASDDIKKLKIYSDLIKCYKKIHEIIKAAIKARYPFYTKPIRLDNITRQNKEFLSECLQVFGNCSLTGIVDNVKIQDKISNDYSFILREFKINQLILVDTCGLDHIQIDSQKEIIRRLDDYHYKMNSVNSTWYEKKEKDRKVAVLFVKKLDAGKPDELRTILPCIRRTIPKAPVYCMFTGIDIICKSEKEVNALDWSLVSNRCPKVVTYILDENSELKKYMSHIQYLVLKNNIIPYCGEPSLLKEQFCFTKSNYQYIRKLIASISMKESSSLEIVEVNDDLIKKLRKSINSIVGYIFAKASLDASDFRWNTINADAMSGYNGELGFCYTYPHCFFQLFHKAYVETIDKNALIILKENNVPSIDAIMSALYETEKKFLGTNENLYKVGIVKEEKNEFREILEKMYTAEDSNDSRVFEYNIFDKQTYDDILTEDKKRIDPHYRNEFFNCVFGFKKGLESIIEYGTENDKKVDSVQECLTDVFVRLLKEQIEDDNKKKSDNIVRISENYFEELQNIEKSFMQKYGMDDKQKFIDLMIRFFENKKNAGSGGSEKN